MSHSSLATAIVNIEYLLEERLNEARPGAPDAAAWLEIATHFRRLACGAIFMDLDADEAVDHLYRSGKVYLAAARGARAGAGGSRTT
ncbi:MAG: hypothetical protein QM767_16000 [Anaeromyxobacter sp.]